MTGHRVGGGLQNAIRLSMWTHKTTIKYVFLHKSQIFAVHSVLPHSALAALRGAATLAPSRVPVSWTSHSRGTEGASAMERMWAMVCITSVVVRRFLPTRKQLHARIFVVSDE